MIRNPFKQDILQKMFDTMVWSYETRHHDLIRADGSRHMGNGAATAFWRGYDGNPIGVVGRAGRQTPSYACYRAGAAIARKERDALPAGVETNPLVKQG
jgi:hypothetical protein